jgi:hypothetical protein
MVDSVVGTGSLGFTAVGLDVVSGEVLGRLALPADAEVSVEVPQFVVVASDVFSSFLERNSLSPSSFSDQSDRQIANEFQRGELPAGLRDQLREVVIQLDGPIIARPSSTVEESLRRSLGGVYTAKIVPNLGDDVDKRVRQLADAVRLVWASTFFADSVNSRLGAGRSLESERMAVVIQRMVGARFGDRFYPTVSIVARSYNHYPAPGNDPEEGVITVALGLGRIIAEGHSWSYSPERPTAPPPFKGVNDLLKFTQNSFYAVDLVGTGPPEPTREGEHLLRLGLADAEQDGTLELLASTYDPESDRLRSGFDGRGPRALTFAPLLRSQTIPFTSVIKSLVDQARAVTGTEVEIEIACCLDPDSGVPARFGVVQLKTMAGSSDRETLTGDDLAAHGTVLASDDCLGDGVRTELTDVVYLKPAAFDRHQTRVMASELEAVNRGLLDERRGAVFVGFGRWGTTDDRHGVPVRWGQISSARVIVEITLSDAPVNLSHGTHFFHHILGQRVLYLSVEHDGDYVIDFDWLEQQPVEWEGRYVRHVRLPSPLEVTVDGRNRRGRIRRDAT